jgi:hypothetical protein
MPALQRARQARLGASTTLFSPQTSTHAHIAVAATDLVRVGGTLSGAFQRSTRRGVYGELFAGVEHRAFRYLQYGLLASVGYGQVTDSKAACDGEGLNEGYCEKPSGYVDHVSARYWRYAAQGYIVLRAPRVVHGGAGLRLALLDMELSEFDNKGSTRPGSPVAVEPFLMVRVGWQRFQVGPELRYVAVVNDPHSDGKKLVLPDRFVIAFGVAVLLGPLKDRTPPIVPPE